jgi:deazaflavin-dependent oxidoreductase (nitroreductase family)
MSTSAALAAPPPLEGALATVVPAVNRSLKWLNRWFMVPMLRLGLGEWIGTPFGGYILLLRVRGRKSGLVRETPLSYLVAEGAVWVMAGFGPRTEWFRNLQADPEVEVWLPGRVLRCRAEEADDPEVRARVVPTLARSIGVPGAMVGCNPWTAPDAEILRLVSWVPLVRLSPVDGRIAAGPDDPGGHAWIWRQALVAGLTLFLLGAGLRAGRRAVRQRR